MTNNAAAPARTLTLADGTEIAVHIREGVEMTYRTCDRCGIEDGHIRHFAHVFGGVCFKCNGAGGTWITVKRAETNAKARKRSADRKEAERLAKVAEAAKGLATFAAENPAVGFLADDNSADEGMHHILSDLSRKLRLYGSLSAGQIALAEKIVREQAERAAKIADEKANAHPAPTGRVTITGEIVHIKYVDDNYSFTGGMIMKLIVKSDDGYKVYVTAPTDIAADVEKGNRVRFTATLTPSDDDPAFAFGKRPAKGEILA